MKRAMIIGLAVAVLLVGASIPPAAAGSPFGSDSRQIGDLDSDLVIIQAEVTEDGTAAFQIQYAIELADENVSQAFEELASDIEENESAYLDRFADRMNATVESAESATGRTMSIGNYDVSTNTANLGKEYGLVTYSATWTGFAEVSADQIQIGDALEGLFIDEETRFQVRWGTEYQLESVDPSPTSTTENEVVWAGPREFGTNEPSIILVPAPGKTETGPTTVEDETEPTTTEEAPVPEGAGLPWELIGLGIAAIALLAIFWFRREGGATVDSTETGGDSGEAAVRSADQEPKPPAELLSNEERVEQYLESVGGRAKQQEIVETLDWTEAKTSQVLSDMHEAGTIEKFRIGRENVVKIAEAEEKTE